MVVKVLVRSGDGEDQFQPDLALVDFANQMRIDYEHIACILGLCTDTEPYYVIYEYLDQVGGAYLLLLVGGAYLHTADDLVIQG